MLTPYAEIYHFAEGKVNDAISHFI